MKKVLDERAGPTTEATATAQFRMPSAAELYAFEQLARRERARAQGELLARAVHWLRRSLVDAVTKPYAAPRGKVVRHA